MNKFCIHCGMPLTGQGAFCSHCGSKQQSTTTTQQIDDPTFVEPAYTFVSTSNKSRASYSTINDQTPKRSKYFIYASVFLFMLAILVLVNTFTTEFVKFIKRTTNGYYKYEYYDYKELSNVGYVIFGILDALCLIALGLIFIFNKRGPFLIIPVSLMFLTSIISFFVFKHSSSNSAFFGDIDFNYSYYGSKYFYDNDTTTRVLGIIAMLFSIFAYASILFFALSEKSSNFKKLKKVVNVIFIVSMIFYIILTIVRLVFSMVDDVYEAGIPCAYIIPFQLFTLENAYCVKSLEAIAPLYAIIYMLTPLFIGLAILKPYNVEKTETEQLDSHYISMGKHVLLLFFTFGVWQYIWIYKTTKYGNNAKGYKTQNPTAQLLLCLFVPLYMIFWTYDIAKRLDFISTQKGKPLDNATTCLILAIFIGIVPPIILQGTINDLVMFNGNTYTPVTTTQSQTTNSIVDELKKYKELLDMGIITQEEFDSKKKQLLGL